jgi:polar amino acid transport system permease protein
MPFAQTLASQFDSHLFLSRLFHPDALFLHALVATIYIAVLSQFFGVLLGLVSALATISRVRLLKWVAQTYVLVFRATPLIVQVFFIYYGATIFLGFDPFPVSVNLQLFSISGAVIAGIVALSLNEGAYMSEIVRAGISAVDPGQLESAKAVGMTYRTAMGKIVLPQAARIIVPPLGNEFNGMIKNTSLLAFIGVYEMFFDAEQHYSETFQPVEYFAAVAVWYMLLTGVWTIVQGRIERRLGASELGESRRLQSGLARLSGWRGAR